jgi:predicted kinase
MEAILFVGIQGSGKTTFYQERFAETHTHISLDVVGARRRERRLLLDCLAGGRPFVVDNTNVTAQDRGPYIEAAKRFGYHVAGYFFDTHLKAAIARNGKRGDRKRVLVPALVRAFKRLEPPQMAEGFDRLVTVKLTSENHFRVETYSEPVQDRQ